VSQDSTEELIKHKLYCWLDSGRECGSDCVVFDRRGALDTTGQHTLCRLCNHLDGLCRSNVSVAQFLKTLLKNRKMPGSDIAPPSV
jgi:hypothetical protein